MSAVVVVVSGECAVPSGSSLVMCRALQCKWIAEAFRCTVLGEPPFTAVQFLGGALLMK